MKPNFAAKFLVINCVYVLDLSSSIASSSSLYNPTSKPVTRIGPTLASLVANATHFPHQGPLEGNGERETTLKLPKRKTKRENYVAKNPPPSDNLSPTSFTKLERVTLFDVAAVNEDSYEMTYDYNNKDVEKSEEYGTTVANKLTTVITTQSSMKEGEIIIEKSLANDAEENCHPTLSPSDLKWKKRNSIIIAILPQVKPSSCNQSLKCSVSTTFHRHISIQEGDSLQVVLQKRLETTSTVPTIDSSTLDSQQDLKNGVTDEKKENLKKAETEKATGPESKSGSNDGKKLNSTHLFSRESHHHLNFLSTRLLSYQKQDKLSLLEEQNSERFIKKRSIFNNATKVKYEALISNVSAISLNHTHQYDSLTIWKVTKSEWASCSTREGGQVATSSSDGNNAIISQDILTVGTHYFIGRSSWSSSECFKLKVLVRGIDCGEGSICSGKGICFANSSMVEYSCGCCRGYSGKHCEERDACVREPCLNAGICVDIVEGHDGDTFQCLCPYGFRGKLCETLSSLCDSNPCQNGGLCEGNHTYYLCRCASGWTGTHCLEKLDTIYSTEEHRYDIADDYEEEFRDEVAGGCANGPCVHGVCVETTAQDFRCFCQPGFGGERCEMEYDECYSNPCPNGGTCVDQIGAYQCLCGPGFTGPNCLTKVNMCMPDPCARNRICRDKGNSYSCDCIPGLPDDDCGARDQVCNPNPCLHGGTCYTIAETLSFYCACRPGFTGQTCQDASILESVGPYGTGEPVEELDLHHSAIATPLSHLKNIYTGAITLACAFIIFLLVVSICHCRINRPYNKCCYLTFKRPPLRFFTPFGMTRSNSLREKLRRERTSAARMESDADGASASMTSQSNSDNVFYNMDVCDNQELPLIK